MKIAIRYFSSKSGHTLKLANAISDELDVKAESVEQKLEEKVDLLFLGSSVYAGTYDKSIEIFLDKNKDKISRIVCFGTSATGKSTRNKIAKWGINTVQ